MMQSGDLAKFQEVTKRDRILKEEKHKKRKNKRRGYMHKRRGR